MSDYPQQDLLAVIAECSAAGAFALMIARLLQGAKKKQMIGTH